MFSVFYCNYFWIYSFLSSAYGTLTILTGPLTFCFLSSERVLKCFFGTPHIFVPALSLVRVNLLMACYILDIVFPLYLSISISKYPLCPLSQMNEFFPIFRHCCGVFPYSQSRAFSRIYTSLRDKMLMGFHELCLV